MTFLFFFFSFKALAMATLLTQSADESLCATCILYGKSVRLFRRILKADIEVCFKSRRHVNSFSACLTDSAVTLILASQDTLCPKLFLFSSHCIFCYIHDIFLKFLPNVLPRPSITHGKFQDFQSCSFFLIAKTVGSVLFETIGGSN